MTTLKRSGCLYAASCIMGIAFCVGVTVENLGCRHDTESVGPDLTSRQAELHPSATPDQVPSVEVVP